VLVTIYDDNDNNIDDNSDYDDCYHAIILHDL
jgi:hypothetical protein